MPAEDCLAISARLRETCAIAADHGIRLLVETHPDTLADTVASTAHLIDEVRSPDLRINFDALHVWEGGTDPVEGLRVLKPFVDHYHLKNVTSRNHLSVFAPDNVYAANGDRSGMTPLFEGTLDYMPLINVLAREPSSRRRWSGSAVIASTCFERIANYCAASSSKRSSILTRRPPGGLLRPDHPRRVGDQCSPRSRANLSARSRSVLSRASWRYCPEASKANRLVSSKSRRRRSGLVRSLSVCVSAFISVIDYLLR